MTTDTGSEDDSDDDASWAAVDAMLNRGDYSAVIETTEFWTAEGDEYCATRMYLAIARWRVGHYRIARRWLRECLRRTPDDRSVVLTVSTFYACCASWWYRSRRLGLYYASKTFALSDRGDWTAYAVMASALANCGQFEAAVEWADMALRLAPEEEKESRWNRRLQYSLKLPARI